MDLWRKYRDLFAPLLASLFSAICNDRGAAAGFNSGSITALFKRGDRTDPANYRPITLLNSDYRAFARVQASRLGPLLPQVVEPHQTAFLPGRLIGENIWVAQTLPRVLALSKAGALAVACDFRKAYDTVDRSFLLKVMEVMGCGPRFRRTVKLLLADTRARVEINGVLSTPARFEAGVRQGCPLAPLLYLFIGQAMSSFLAKSGVGVLVASTRLVVTQFADDTIAYLPGWDHVPTFLGHMLTFGRASGQFLNQAKTRAIPMGTLAAAAPPPAAQLVVEGAPQVLGVPLPANLTSGIRPPRVDWAPRLGKVEQRLQRLSSLCISAFGRAFAASSYALSCLLYTAEFSGPPKITELTKVERQVAALVDAKRGPDDRDARGFCGVSAANQLGSPCIGGFGVLPLRQHVMARHVVWAVRLALALLADRIPPWAQLARFELTRLSRGTLLTRSGGVVDIFFYCPTPAERRALSPLLRLVFKALRVMPRPVMLAATPLPAPAAVPCAKERQKLLLAMWSWPAADGSGGYPISGITVRSATAILMAGQYRARSDGQLHYCQLVRTLAAAAPSAENLLQTLLRQLWRSPICNVAKEPFWRLVVNALPTAQRRHAHGESCACGATYPGRRHHFWECPVARAVICDIQRQLDGFTAAAHLPGQQLSALNIWLAEVPAGVLSWLWMVVCLAAIAAMDHGRSAMAALSLAASAPASGVVRSAGNSSVARFWSLLEEAAVSRRFPAPRAGTVQPFFRFCGGWTVARRP